MARGNRTERRGVKTRVRFSLAEHKDAAKALQMIAWQRYGRPTTDEEIESVLADLIREERARQLEGLPVNQRTTYTLIGSYENALRILRDRPEGEYQELRDEARRFIGGEIAEICDEDTDGLYDWVAEGDWNGAMMETHGPEVLAAEWDQYTRHARNEA